MPYKVGVTTGLYTIARSEEISTTVRKIDFAISRGASAIEVSGDVPHEVTETEGRQIRYIARKQGVEILWHGSLTIPMCMPERAEWRDAQDHMMKSVRSAVFSGSKYVDFHSCLNIWLELMTYAGRKMTMVFCDHEGNFIGKILKENKDIRNWFVDNRWEDFIRDVLTDEEITMARSRGQVEAETVRREETSRQLRAGKISEEVINYIETRNTIPSPPAISESMYQKIRNIMESGIRQFSIIAAEKDRRYLKEAINRKLLKEERWHSEELRTATGVIDGYHIMAHYLFYTKDKIWTKMAEMYKDVLDRYHINYRDKDWLSRAWHEAEKNNDREFKEFFYAVVGAKFMQGHLEKLDKWIKDVFIKKELAQIKDSKERAELGQIAKDLKIAIEVPDARDPIHAGLYLLWHPKQIYAAVTAIRESMGSDRVWMLQDWEHLATQGLDAINEAEELIKTAPDAGEITLAVHANAPNPMHGHIPLELGDIRIYQLLYCMRQTGFGKSNHKVYVIFERGAAKAPYQESVTVLRLAVKSLEQDILPDELPEEYFGMKGPVAGNFHRQRQIIQDHAWEPLKDLLEVPGEEWTFLSQSAMKKGKKPEVWKKGEFR